ncbi:hypothetical protein BDV24DRAFT_108103 [Aspergillus arachidicola]|uniref:Uncharacterized protein n=1 Tax=Aspergillus arachidicola TaxID=656916 RepID=A0A5N6YLT6_9EURO|nr:hypothetical protein BDV24DRAFT_108103 [Aspergillus arachidicola]
MHSFGVINADQAKGNMLTIDWLYWAITIPLTLSVALVVMLRADWPLRRLSPLWLSWYKSEKNTCR